ncbi:MAG: hypothetical protein ACRDQ0_04295 [Pseudonocardia sp.]
MAVDTLDDWYRRNSERVLAHQRSQVDTAKILVTFTLAVAATLVATALQVEAPNGLDIAASVVLGIGFLVTIAVIFLDRIAEPNRSRAEKKARQRNLSDDQLLELLQDLALDAEDENDTIVDQVKLASIVQVHLSITCAVLATLSLLL